MELVLVGITRDGKIIEKGFKTTSGFLDVQLSENFELFSLNEKTTCIELGNKTIINGEETKEDCTSFMRRYVKCIDEILISFGKCNNIDLLEDVKFANEKIKYLVYLVEEEIIVPFIGDNEMDALSFNIVNEYKHRMASDFN
ncbi:hypothetical protein [Acidianus sp. HS-5]|uniref:hypothetical protein n=1 Tax=Acidianus sp. HS-5 TaxID=2886040 RepID=UPI001F352596|nr:hypothetical protein [Acidianus sp. HS-5]BDC17806.1 hypothetical protein HS5_06960 [Acidianus sp. HS-5]